MPNDPGGAEFALAALLPEDPLPAEADIEELKAAILARLALSAGKDAAAASARDWFVATALVLRDRVIHRALAGPAQAGPKKRVFYLSLEFLTGRLLQDVAANLRLDRALEGALGDLGADPKRLIEAEPEPALGNGGLGRLAACYLESMASLGIPACGYGIRYDYGLFRQRLRDGWQQEEPEDWLAFGNPWEFARPELAVSVGFGGRVEHQPSRKGERRALWHPEEMVEALAYDIAIVGWRARRVNWLRLWSARAPVPLRLDIFNGGDHAGALAQQARAEALSKVLYPSDSTPAGRELRLRQEYFFASAALQDILRFHLSQFGSLYSLPEQAAVQLNDTHPAIAVAELMRLLVDCHNLPWEDAWRITVSTFSYTNHTLLPEALESWPVALFERVLPRHLEIIYRINDDHLKELGRRGEGDPAVVAEVSLIGENGERHVRMANLAFLGSRKVNGVSALHTELMRRTVFAAFHRLYPERIVNKTNGISFRRWLYEANPDLASLVCRVTARDIMADPQALAALAECAEEEALQEELAAIKRRRKGVLARYVREETGIALDPEALFDVQIKRIHEYKRQLLNLLQTIALYRAIRADPALAFAPRVKIFAGKAAASYGEAKLIIKLINDAAAIINADPLVAGRLKLVFLPNYNVSLAQLVIPAADLSEQISTAGMEASGTGNMKLALNGALTIGTLDGANIEIRERVGEENMFIFGLNAEEAAERRRRGPDADAFLAASPALSQVLEALTKGEFSGDDPRRFWGLVEGLVRADHFLVLADFAAYRKAQERVDALWQDPRAWRRAALLNIAGMGWFAADRAVAEYAREIWNLPPAALS